MSPILALTGFMAAGKSTAGRALAAMLNWRFVDLDCEIERRAGQSIREIFSLHGEDRFRELEAGALRAALEDTSVPRVIALGGGTFIQPRNAELLRHCGARVVFLELPLEQLFQRCRGMCERSDPNPRPLAENEDAFGALYAQRLPFYRQADLVVNVEEKTPEQIAREIARDLRLQTSAASLKEAHRRGAIDH